MTTIKAFGFGAHGTVDEVECFVGAVDPMFLCHDEYVTWAWRPKQLEYAGLRSLMGRREDFRAVTREALRYSSGTLGLLGIMLLDSIVYGYDTLLPYSEAAAALGAPKHFPLAISSNSSSSMLGALVRNSSRSQL